MIEDFTSLEARLYLYTQILGASITEVPIWDTLPMSTIRKIVDRKKQKNIPKKEDKDIMYQSQAEADAEWEKQFKEDKN